MSKWKISLRVMLYEINHEDYQDFSGHYFHYQL